MAERQPPYGGRLPDVDGLHWRGNENCGYFVDKEGRWVDVLPHDIKPPRVKILDVEPLPFIVVSRPV